MSDLDEVAPAITSPAAFTVRENATAVGTVAASDPSVPVTFAIAGGPDAARFTLNAATGALTFSAAPDFETPTDVGRNNVYDLVVRATDSVGNAANQTVAVTVSDLDEVAPRLVSSSPADNAVAVAVAASIVLTFSEAVQIGAGSLTITDGAGDVRSISVADASQVQVAGQTVTINPLADLRGGAGYDVLVAAGAFKDAAGNGFGGLSIDQLDFVTQANPVTGTSGSNLLTGTAGNDLIDGGAGSDTLLVNQPFSAVTVTRGDNGYVFTGPDGRDVVRNVENFAFSDGVIKQYQGGGLGALVDDLFYYASNPDVYAAGVDAQLHYGQFGIREGRDPNAFFDTTAYLAANPDVARAGVNPLEHYYLAGWREGRDPGPSFDDESYLARNPDVAAAGVNPLEHYLLFGQAEGRTVGPAIGPRSTIGATGFDREFYLLSNEDVARSGIDPQSHFNQYGWREGRDPNALFDTSAYLQQYGDVRAAGVNPLEHYHATGFREGRDPSGAFDTSSYLAANPDVAAAGVDPLVHYLTFGAVEGRSTFADGSLVI